MRAIIFDTETTGLNEPEIVEVAWIDAEDIHQQRGPSFYVKRFKPSKDIELGALATHHILPSDVEDCPPSSAFRLPDEVEYLLGFNIDFDWQVIGSPESIKRIDICAICRNVLPGLDCYSQTAIYYHLFGKTELSRSLLLESHSAGADVIICSKIYERLSSVPPTPHLDIEALWQFSEECRIPNVMPFGKHKGLSMSEVPADYRRWYANCTNPPPDQYILKAFEKYPCH